MKPLNLFYAEPEADRWFKFDRYPRKLIRRLVRGKTRPGGVMMVALNLMAGLDKLGIPYRFNDYSYIKKHPEDIACIIGKPHILFDRQWRNPVIFGAGIFSHPVDHPDLLKDHPNIKQILVPGPWMEQIFKPFYGDVVTAWPTGIDTEKWQPLAGSKTIDFLVYNKISADERYHAELVVPVLNTLKAKGLSYQMVNYGSYRHAELKEKLSQSLSAIFLSKSETQGLAYQQILATNTPVLAWDKGGYWEDPAYYPHRVKYQPISSVPYWDERCGLKFTGAQDFEAQLTQFAAQHHKFEPRQYILDNLTLELCAQKYVDIYNRMLTTLSNK